MHTRIGLFASWMSKAAEILFLLQSASEQLCVFVVWFQKPPSKISLEERSRLVWVLRRGHHAWIEMHGGQTFITHNAPSKQRGLNWLQKPQKAFLNPEVNKDDFCVHVNTLHLHQVNMQRQVYVSHLWCHICKECKHWCCGCFQHYSVCLSGPVWQHWREFVCLTDNSWFAII